MSIQSFLESAEILFNRQKYKEALCLVCIAIDSRAAQDYPNEKSANRYKKFLKKHFRTICEYGFPGISADNIRIKVNVPHDSLKTDQNGYVDMEQIIYHVIRCGLVHECNIDDTISFTDETYIGDWDEKFYLPKNIILGLIASIKQ